MIIRRTDQDQGGLVHIAVYIAVWFYFNKQCKSVRLKHGCGVCNGSAPVRRTVSAGDPAGCYFKNIICVTYRIQCSAVAECNSACILQRICKCHNSCALNLNLKSLCKVTGLCCHLYRCILLRQSNCSIVRDDGCIIRRPADGVSVKVYRRKRQLCGFFHCRRKFHAVPEVLLILISDLLICQCGAVDAVAVQVAFVIFSVSPVCLTNIKDPIISQNFRKAEITCHLFRSLDTIYVNGHVILRKYHIYMYPVTSRLCNSCRCTRIRMVVPLNFRCASRLCQDPDICLLQIFLDICVRRGKHDPVSGVCQIRLCVIGYRDLLLPCQKTSSFQLCYIQIAGAIQIQGISAVCFPHCRGAFLCRLRLSALKTVLQVIKGKLCQQRKLFCRIRRLSSGWHQSTYHRSSKK